MEVTLMQMLDAREKRAQLQVQLNRQYGKSLVSFSMNIPGPVKDSPLIRRGFRVGCEALDALIPAETVLHRDVTEAVTGCEAMYVVNMDSRELKTITTRIEDTHGLGRLFDMDVIGPDLCKLDRDLVGGGERNCIVCGAPGRGCASRRIHAVSELQAATVAILNAHFAKVDADTVSNLAVQSLLDEVDTTPKPGLVDRRNSGSHRDMNIGTFYASANALRPYFRSCVRCGMETAADPGEATFLQLRQLGLQAEQAMFAATGGVNTHKGAIFTMGILCGAAGRLWKPEDGWEEREIFREVAAMTRETMEQDFLKGGDTVGQRLYRDYGIRGIRGQAAEGLPAVAELGLPRFRAYLQEGLGQNEAGIRTLLHLIARVEDTNMIARGGMEGAKQGAEVCAALLEQEFTLADVEKLDDWFISRNLSPGGCADLLAAVYFLQALTK